MVYSNTRQEYDQALEALQEDEMTEKYPQFYTHISNSYLGRVQKWALYSRLELQLPTGGVNTSNFVEASFRVLKDFIFNRQKAYNITELLDVLFTENSSHYQRILVDVGNSRFNFTHTSKAQHKAVKTSIRQDQVHFLTDQLYLVESENDSQTLYTVDMR